MAPRKTEEAKEPKKRGRKPRIENPKVATKKPLKIPTVIKFKIPTSTALDGVKNVSGQVKIDLANEVALAQLCPVNIKTEPQEVEVQPPKKSRKKPAAEKKKSDINGDTTTTIMNNSETVGPSVQPVKSGAKKPALKRNRTQKKPSESHSNEVTATEPVVKKKRLNRKPKTPSEKGIEPTTSTTALDKTKTPQSQENSAKTVQQNPTIQETKVTSAKRSSRRKTIPVRYGVDKAIDGSKLNIDEQSSSKTVKNVATLGFSTTQDVTSTSTISVKNNNLVVINNKLPVVQMTPVTLPVVEPLTSSSESSCSTSSSSESVSDSRELDLSVSTSISECRQAKDAENPSNVAKMNSRVDLNAVTAMLEEGSKKFAEFESYLDSRFAFGSKPTPRAVFDALKLESEVIALSREFCKCMSEMDDGFVLPRTPRPKTGEPVENYDDDALSLFAESITGFESLRISNVDEYVPTPVVPTPPARHYEPTRIEPQARQTVEINTADSTWIKDRFEDPKIDDTPSQTQDNPRFKSTSVQAETTHSPAEITCSQSENTNSQPENINLQSENTHLGSTNESEPTKVIQKGNRCPVPPRPLRLRSVFSLEPKTFGTSSLLHGLCFRNLSTGNCRFDPCRFSHQPICLETIKRRLISLPDASAMCEMRLVWAYPGLKRELGGIFVEEFCRRGLTRAMMEALPVVMFAPDNKIPMEAALMHLANVDLEEVQDILTEPICDALLTTLADTLNFSNFRKFFSQLSSFLAKKNLKVGLDVATKILERVCILPCDDLLAQSILNVINHTDEDIFDKGPMQLVERQLKAVGVNLGDFKKGKVRTEPSPSKRAEPELERYTSPDTTHFDNVNPAPVVSPTITRTVDFKHSRTNTAFVNVHNKMPPPRILENSWRKPGFRFQRPNVYNNAPKLKFQRNHNRYMGHGSFNGNNY